jgi:serine/threonine-protein kinase RsbW
MHFSESVHLSAMKQKLFPADASRLREMIQFIRKESSRLGVREDMGKRVQVIAEEIIVNIINHGYGGQDGRKADETILITMALDERKQLHLEFVDQGKHFNINDMHAEPMTEPRIGGLGVFLIQRLADELSYRRENKNNVLHVVLRDALDQAEFSE